MTIDFNVEGAVRERDGAASRRKEAALCCPVEYDPQFLRLLPNEIDEMAGKIGCANTELRYGKIAGGFVNNPRRTD